MEITAHKSIRDTCRRMQLISALSRTPGEPAASRNCVNSRNDRTRKSVKKKKICHKFRTDDVSLSLRLRKRKCFQERCTYTNFSVRIEYIPQTMKVISDDLWWRGFTGRVKLLNKIQILIIETIAWLHFPFSVSNSQNIESKIKLMVKRR